MDVLEIALFHIEDLIHPTPTPYSAIRAQSLHIFQDYIQGGISLEQAQTLYAEILRKSKIQNPDEQQALESLCKELNIGQQELRKLTDDKGHKVCLRSN